MDLLHQRVAHPRFGTGEITGQSRRQLSVSFSSAPALRRFLYPAAFFGYLVLCDDAAQAQLEAELARSGEAKEFLRRQESARSIRQAEQQRQIRLLQHPQRRTRPLRRGPDGRQPLQAEEKRRA